MLTCRQPVYRVFCHMSFASCFETGDSSTVCEATVLRACCARTVFAKTQHGVTLVRLIASQHFAEGKQNELGIQGPWYMQTKMYIQPYMHHTQRLSVAVGCACLVLLGFASSITAVSVRGVAPNLIASYDTNADAFKCLDGSKLLQTSRINDEYCDCPDGSDEPGRVCGAWHS